MSMSQCLQFTILYNLRKTSFPLIISFLFDVFPHFPYSMSSLCTIQVVKSCNLCGFPELIFWWCLESYSINQEKPLFPNYLMLFIHSCKVWSCKVYRAEYFPFPLLPPSPVDTAISSRPQLLSSLNINIATVQTPAPAVSDINVGRPEPEMWDCESGDTGLGDHWSNMAAVRRERLWDTQAWHCPCERGKQRESWVLNTDCPLYIKQYQS